VNGRTLAYTARAGHIPIRVNDSGEVHGTMFFSAYTLDTTDAPRRPITFLWNGGPGSSSSLVHLIGFGPKRLDENGVPVANDGTWLAMSDLVFVDPIGTGYSRPVKAEYAAEFYQNRGDAESVAEFIRIYITRAGAWDVPLFLAGESFGVTRAVRVAGVLERNDTPVRGLMLIGLVPPLAQVDGVTRSALALPTFAATAHYHGKAGPPSRSLEQVTTEAASWALETWAPALARQSALRPVEREAIRDRLAAIAGLDPAHIDSTLMVRMERFTHQLLEDDALVVGRYDARLTGPVDPQQQMYDPTRDPSLRGIIDDVAVVRYLRNELRFLSDLRYQGPFGGGYPPPTSFRGDWMSVLWNREDIGRLQFSTNDTVPELQRLLRANGRLHVYAACGWYDLVCSQAVIEHMAEKLDATTARRVVVRGYAGGHAIYTDDAVRRQMRDDVSAFFAQATARN
jgi:carboxypeptidase C (cathepsin A)